MDFDQLDFDLLDKTCDVYRYGSGTAGPFTGATYLTLLDTLIGTFPCAFQVKSAQEYGTPAQTGGQEYDVYFKYGANVQYHDILQNVTGISRTSFIVISEAQDDGDQGTYARFRVVTKTGGGVR